MNKISLGALFLILVLTSCNKDKNVDHRGEMRNLVQKISAYAKAKNPNFVVIPQNGQELFTGDGTKSGVKQVDYLAAIDGQGREDLYYGYDSDNQATPGSVSAEMEGLLDIGIAEGVSILVTDYVSDVNKMDDSYAKNEAKGYLSFAADRRDLDNIPAYPTPHNENADSIGSLTQAKNFLYILDPSPFGSAAAFAAAVSATNYDALITDLFFEETQLSSTEIADLRKKLNGGSRLLIAYMSIGEAEEYRYYWQSSWKKGNPGWIKKENPDWPGNYKVRYWDSEWQDLLFGSHDAYLDRILQAGFDGVYLDIIDAFEFFE